MRGYSGLKIIIFTALSIFIAVFWGSTGFYFPHGEILRLRLLRVMSAVVVGAHLGTSGALYQTSFRNPLADPYLMGSAGGAGLGIVLALLGGATFPLVQFSAFSGSLTATLLALFLAGFTGRISSSVLVLSGIAVTAFASSLIMLVVTVFMPQNYASTVALLTGNLGASTFQSALYAGISGLFLWPLMVLESRKVEAMVPGEDFALSVGVKPQRVLRTAVVLGSLSSSFAVTCGGIIGFVGLMVPHFVRTFGVRRVRDIVLWSGFMGCGFMALTDAISRSAFRIEVSVGVVTGVLGAPFLAYLMWRRYRAGV